MATTKHSKIRFIGYAISTFPAHLGEGYGGGIYLGNPNMDVDIEARITILKNAVDTAKAQIPSDQDDASVTNVFMAPEFFFHSPHGPYIYPSADQDPIPKILARLLETFNVTNYPNWTFVFGTALSAQIANPEKLFLSESVKARNEIVKFLVAQEEKSASGIALVVSNTLKGFIRDCQNYPDVIVRDRALIVSNIPLDSPVKPLQTKQMTTEKYFISGEDFILFDTEGKHDVVTEQMVAYRHIDLSNGDLKERPDDFYAIFRQNYGVDNFPNYVDFGVEICLDHDDERLRLNLGQEPFPKPNDAVHVQLVPSCGSAIAGASVVTDAYGFVFNCDGQYPLDGTHDQVQQASIGGVQCVFVNYNPSPSGAYNYHSAHTQLARVQSPAQGNNPNVDSASFQTLDVTDIYSFPVVTPQLAVGNFNDYFAGGSGAVHIYGLHQAYELYPLPDSVTQAISEDEGKELVEKAAVS
jgi:hypothetical protein